MPNNTSVTKKKKINLALQGGGSHGAYTWGVLDALLEDGRLEFDAISSTSSGSINALAIATGLANNGTNKDARKAMHDIWHEISFMGKFYSPVHQMDWEKYCPTAFLPEHPSFLMFQTAVRMFSPYQFNPLDFNPLRQVINDKIDFNAIQHSKAVELYVSATCVETGDARVFRHGELNDDVIMASAALPFMYQAVNINGWHYWDGGFMGNPVLTPLIHERTTKDLLLVQINPVIRISTPKTSYDIENRMMEIAFNSALEGELRNIVALRKMRRDGWMKKEFENQLPEVRFHSIRGDEEVVSLPVSSKFNTDWDFLLSLRNQGRKAAKLWLEDYFDYVGVADSVDFEDEFL